MLQEMAIQIDSLPVFYRQRDTLFYPPVISRLCLAGSISTVPAAVHTGSQQ